MALLCRHQVVSLLRALHARNERLLRFLLAIGDNAPVDMESHLVGVANFVDVVLGVGIAEVVSEELLVENHHTTLVVGASQLCESVEAKKNTSPWSDYHKLGGLVVGDFLVHDNAVIQEKAKGGVGLWAQ